VERFNDIISAVAACVKKGLESCLPDICKGNEKALGFIPVPNKGPLNRKIPTCVVLRPAFVWGINILVGLLVFVVLVCVLRCVVCGGCCGGCGRRRGGLRSSKKVRH